MNDERSLWFLGGSIFLAMWLSNFSNQFGMPVWLFYTVAFALVVVLAMTSSKSQGQPQLGDQSPGSLRRVLFYVVLVVVIAEVIWFGFVMRNWTLLAGWFSITLLCGVSLYLAAAYFIEKSIPLRYILVPAISLILGLILPNAGFAYSFPLIFSILSFGTGLWLHINDRKSKESLG